MVTPFQRFKSQYPEGGLTADLISIYDNQYVVRVVLTDKGQTLTTGMASSVDVQIAEDKARDRALALIGITTGSPATAQTTPPAQSPTAAQEEPSQSQTNAPEVAVSVTGLPPEDSSEADIPKDERAPLIPEDEDMGPPIDAMQEEPTKPAAPKPSAATIALENFSTSATPVDLSDVIAQTDVYMTRLGWTNVQGREYLDQTYGKISRQHLNDEELMSFLLYLEAQI